jgi:outer membrane protein TolC
VFKNRTATLFSIALFAAAAVSAQTPPEAASAPGTPSPAGRVVSTDPVLDELVAEALEKNPDVAGALSSAEAARLRIQPARTLPDPSVSFNYQNDGKGFSLGQRDMTFLGAMFSQPIPWPGKLRLAGEEARNRAEEVKVATVGRARLGIEARVRRAYYDYLLAREQLNLTEDRSRSWREISDIVRERYAVGLGVQQDVLRTQIELLRLDEARAELGAEVVNRRAEVNRVVGRPQDSEFPAPSRLAFRAASPELPALLQDVRDRSPELAGIERAIEAARLRAALAKKNFLPDFVASGGPMYRGGLDPMWQVALGVSLPIFAGSRQRPLLAAAEAEIRIEEARASSARQELEFRTRERFANLAAALKVARLYNEGVLPVDQLSLESAIASYRTGKVPFVTVLEALNTLYGDRSLLLTRLAEVEKWRVSIAEADLQASAGMSPAGSSPAPAAMGSSSPAASSAAMR